MSLLKKLQIDRDEAMEMIEELNNRIAPLEESIEHFVQMVADYDVAIAALTPAPEPVPEPVADPLPEPAPVIEVADWPESWTDPPAQPVDEPAPEPQPEPELVQPEWNDGGYAPVTNPDADAVAKSLDYYSPEAIERRQKFDIFAPFKREREDA